MRGTSKTRRSGTIVPRGKGRWLVRVSPGINPTTGKRLRVNKIIAGKKADAEKYLTDMLGRNDTGVSIALSRQTLGEWLNEYWSTWSGDLAPRTKQKFQENIRLYVPTRLLATKLTALTPRHFQEAYNEMQAAGLARGTIAYTHRILRARLNDAVRLGRIVRNPATVGVTLPARPHTEARTFTQAEARRFLDAVRADRYAAFWTLLLLTGLRPGEALGLKWQDWDGATLRVQRSLVRLSGGAWELKSTKTGRPRVVSLPELAIRALREHRQKQLEERLLVGASYTDNGLMFATHFGTPLNLNTEVPRRFKRMLRDAGLPNLRLYDLRHSAATLLLAAGEHPKIVQERLGHASITLTLDTYSHVLPDMQRRTAERLDAMLGEQGVVAAVG
jgi:integrase